jgi:hypothetical protein
MMIKPTNAKKDVRDFSIAAPISNGVEKLKIKPIPTPMAVATSGCTFLKTKIA